MTEVRKRLGLLSTAGIACGTLLSLAPNSKAVVVGVDPTTMINGYMNVTDLPSKGGAYEFGSGWGAADLDSSFTGSTVKLTPNTSIDRDVPNDTFWWQDASGTSPGNKIMDASLYAENDSITDTSYTFNYSVLLNTLVAPYTSVAFIKAFTPGFSYYFGEVTAPLTVGNGSISVSTSIPAFAGLAPGDVIQYGFETIGPDARLAQEASLGSVVVGPAAVPEPMSIGLFTVVIPLLGRRRRM